MKYLDHNLILILLIIISVFQPIGLFSQQSKENGTISGKIVDAKTGEALIGARVILKGTKFGGLSKYDGSFIIKNVTPGDYELEINYIGYSKYTVSKIIVEPGGLKKFEVAMQDMTIQKDEVVVTARAIKTTGAALLKDRQKAESVSDAIGAEEISRSGSSDAADAAKKITGATTEGGKYVYIRGLGDRYSSTQLNGAQLPSADPDKKAVHLDLFPASLIENIVTIKTATPDKPGDFTGGTLNINTKSFPDQFYSAFSIQTGINSIVTGKNDFLTYPGGGSDWLGFDDGKREIPQPIQDVLNSGGDIPYLSSAYTNPEDAHKLDELSKSFDPVMSPTNMTAPVNHKFSLSVGDQFNVFKESFGILASFSYDRKFTSYRDGIGAFYSLTGDISKTDKLTDDNKVSDNKSSDEVLWGGMLNMSYNISTNNKIGMNFMYNQNGQSVARYQVGYDRYYGLDRTYETRVLQFTERNLSSFQLTGNHNLDFANNSKIDWQVSYSKNNQTEPDLRFFTNDYTVDDGDTLFDIDQSLYKYPSRYFRDLNEDLFNGKVDFEIPMKQIFDGDFKFKTGLSYVNKQRSFKEQRFDIAQDLTSYKYRYNGDPDNYFKNNTGILDSTTQYRYGNYIQYYNPNAASYTGNQDIFGAYGMLDWFVIDDLRIITGVRLESTDISVNSLDTNKSNRNGKLNENDVLPSMNIVYQLKNNMNLRAAYGKTLARPNFREFAPYSSFEYVGGYILLGNDSLKRTLINNFDLRWEWYTNPGEIIAVSAFYKDFTNPIERVIINTNKEIKYNNVEKAILYGAEIEFRKTLGFLGGFFEKFQLGTNFTLVYSEVDIAKEELDIIKLYDPGASSTRPLQGQSPYIVNVDLGYVDYESGTDAAIQFNVFGSRLSEVTKQGTPDIFEMPRPDLNIILSQKFFDTFKLTFKAKNILDSYVHKTQEFKGTEYTTQKYYLGREFTVSFSYTIN